MSTNEVAQPHASTKIEDELTRVATGATLNFSGRILHAGMLYVYAIMVARLLDPRTFGLVMLGLTLINLAGVLGRLGLELGTVRFVSMHRGADDPGRMKGTLTSALKYSFVASLLLSCAVLFLAGPLAVKGLGKPELVGILRGLSVSIPFWSVLLVCLGFTMGLQTMKYWVVGHDIFWPLMNILLVGTFFAMGYGVKGVVAAHVLSVILASVLSVAFVLKSYPGILKVTAVEEGRRLLRVSMPLSFSILLTFIIMWTDTIMLGIFRSSAEVGIYNAAMRTAQIASMLLMSFNMIFAPIIADLYGKQDFEKMKMLFRIVTKWVFTLSLLVLICVIFRAQEILALFGTAFESGSPCLKILTFAQFVNGSVGCVGFMLAMTDRQNWVMYSTIFACLVNTLLNYLLIPSYGIVGASVATGTTVIMVNLILLLLVFLALRMHPYDKRFLKIAASGALTCGALYLLESVLTQFSGIPGLFLFFVLCIGIYGGVILAWGLDEEDKFFVQLIRKRVATAFS